MKEQPFSLAEVCSDVTAMTDHLDAITEYADMLWCLLTAFQNDPGLMNDSLDGARRTLERVSNVSMEAKARGDAALSQIDRVLRGEVKHCA